MQLAKTPPPQAPTHTGRVDRRKDSPLLHHSDEDTAMEVPISRSPKPPVALGGLAPVEVQGYLPRIERSTADSADLTVRCGSDHPLHRTTSNGRRPPQEAAGRIHPPRCVTTIRHGGDPATRARRGALPWGTGDAPHGSPAVEGGFPLLQEGVHRLGGILGVQVDDLRDRLALECLSDCGGERVVQHLLRQ